MDIRRFGSTLVLLFLVVIAASGCPSKQPSTPRSVEEHGARSAEQASHAVPQTERPHPVDGMVRVPGGPFFMGCNDQVDTQCDGKEKPGRGVDVEAFEIDVTETTVEDYQKCADAGRCGPSETGVACNWSRPGRAKHPMNCVTWRAAVMYCEWRGKRLPTEVEWEKAARGGDGRKYPWGNTGPGSAGRVANVCDAHCPARWKRGDYDDGHEETAPVGTYPDGVSPFGAFDMAGNVWEWTADAYHGPVGPESVADDPAVGDAGKDYRIVRGGSWGFPPSASRTSLRNPIRADASGSDVGFRCAR